MGSKVCHHSFSKAAIMLAITKGKGKARCPVVGACRWRRPLMCTGCPHQIAKGDLEVDRGLVRRLERFRKAASAVDDSDVRRSPLAHLSSFISLKHIHALSSLYTHSISISHAHRYTLSF